MSNFGRRLERYLKWQDYAVNCNGTYYGYCYGQEIPGVPSAPFANDQTCETGTSDPGPYYYGCLPGEYVAYNTQEGFCDYLPSCASTLDSKRIPNGL